MVAVAGTSGASRPTDGRADQELRHAAVELREVHRPDVEHVETGRARWIPAQRRRRRADVPEHVARIDVVARDAVAALAIVAQGETASARGQAGGPVGERHRGDGAARVHLEAEPIDPVRAHHARNGLPASDGIRGPRLSPTSTDDERYDERPAEVHHKPPHERSAY